MSNEERQERNQREDAEREHQKAVIKELLGFAFKAVCYSCVLYTLLSIGLG